MSPPIEFPTPDSFNDPTEQESPIIEAYLHPERVQNATYNGTVGFQTDYISQYVIVDAAGNGNVCNWRVKVINYGYCDPLPDPCQYPPINTYCPQPKHVWCNDLNTTCDCVHWDEPTFEDFNDDLVRIEQSHYVGHQFPLGKSTITYTAYDSMNHSAECMFDIYIIDNRPPVFVHCPNSTEIGTDPGKQNVDYHYYVEAVDMCQYNDIVTYSTGAFPTAPEFANDTIIYPNGNEVLDPGKYWFWYEAMDGSNNIDVCTWLVVVYDNEAPVVVCPDNIIYQLPNTDHAVLPAYDRVTLN